MNSLSVSNKWSLVALVCTGWLLSSCMTFHIADCCEPSSERNVEKIATPSTVTIAMVDLGRFPSFYRVVQMLRDKGYVVRHFRTFTEIKQQGIQPDLIVIFDGKWESIPSTDGPLDLLNGTLCLFSVGIIPYHTTWRYSGKISFFPARGTSTSVSSYIGYRSFKGWLPWLFGMPFAAHSSSTGRNDSYQIGMENVIAYEEKIRDRIIIESQASYDTAE